MAKFIGWVVIIILVLVGISALINGDDESSDSDKTESLKPEEVEALNDEKKIERTNNQYVSSSKKGIVACPTSTGIERFVDVSIDDSKGDNDRIMIVDDNNCSIVGERDIITLLSEKKADGTMPLAGQYTYEIGTSAFAIILVDIERGEHRVSSERDIDDGRYWVITSIMFDNSWKKGEEPPLRIETEPESEKPESEKKSSVPPKVTHTVDTWNPVFVCFSIGVFETMFRMFEHLNEEMQDEMMADFIDAGCQYVQYGESMIVIPDAVTVEGPNDEEVILVHLRLLEPELGKPDEVYVIFQQLLANTKVTDVQVY